MTKQRLIGFSFALMALLATSALAADGEVQFPTGNALDTDKGKAIYDSACAECHATGKSKAPKLSRKKDWNHAKFKSYSLMEKHARKGFLNMPSKGGRPILSDQDVANAVLYMEQNIGKK